MCSTVLSNGSCSNAGNHKAFLEMRARNTQAAGEQRRGRQQAPAHAEKSRTNLARGRDTQGKKKKR